MLNVVMRGRRKRTIYMFTDKSEVADKRFKEVTERFMEYREALLLLSHFSPSLRTLLKRIYSLL